MEKFMPRIPVMPFYPDAHLVKTKVMSSEEHGIYFTLLCNMWLNEGWVDDEDAVIARLTGITPLKWKKIKPKLSKFLVFSDGKITQRRLLEEFNKVQEKIEKNRQNISKRWAKKEVGEGGYSFDLAKNLGQKFKNPFDTTV